MAGDEADGVPTEESARIRMAHELSLIDHLFLRKTESYTAKYWGEMASNDQFTTA